jgi:hypothetical protein
MASLPCIARAGLALALAAPACTLRDAYQDAAAPSRSASADCARDESGEVCLRARTDCPPGALDCERALVDPIGQLRRLPRVGAPLSFRAGAMASVDGRNHFQSVQRIPGAGPARFVVTRSTAKPQDADVGLVQPGRRVRAAFDLGTSYTHAGGGQRMGAVFAVPLERGAGGSAVVLLDLSDAGVPRVLATVPHVGPAGQPIDQAGTASLAALADGRYLLVIGRRHANQLDFYRSTTSDLATTGWSYLDVWFERELATAIGDRDFGDYQNLALVPAADGALYLLGSHRQKSGIDWLDLHRLSMADSRRGLDVLVTKVARKHVRCSVAGAEHCNLDAGAGAYVGADGRLRVYGITRSTRDRRSRGSRAQVGMMEFVSAAAPSLASM